MLNKLKNIVLIAILSSTLFSCNDNDVETLQQKPEENVTKQKPTKETVAIKFDSRVGDEDFGLNKNFTINNSVYNFKILRYWVSNVSLISIDGEEFKVPNSYFLIEENVEFDSPSLPAVYPANKREKVEINLVPSGKYKAIKFSIGVDSKYNDNLSLQAGELAQGNGMVNINWMWITSYIFTKTQGTITQGENTKGFVADTGLNDNYRTLTVDTSFEVKSGTDNNIVINLDVKKLFKGINLLENSTIGGTTKELMKTLSDNYKAAFSAK